MAYHYQQEDLEWIMANSKRYTVQEMAFELALPKNCIYNICSRYGLEFKSEWAAKHERQLIQEPAQRVFDKEPALCLPISHNNVVPERYHKSGITI
jgi:hypothetical protein